MTLDEMIAEFRIHADDVVGGQYLFSDDTIKRFLAEGEVEAAIRARLLHESQDNGLCRIRVTSGKATYLLDESLYELTHIAFVDADGTRHPLKLVSAEDLDAALAGLPVVPPHGDDYDWGIRRSDWRDAEGRPAYVIQTDQAIRLVPKPNVAGHIQLEAYRLPMGGVGSDPEIGAAHHRHLIQWALYRAFAIPDNDAVDPERSMAALAAFTQYFGMRPDSDLRRTTRHDVPHHVTAFFV